MLTKEELMKMTGQQAGERGTIYKLNELTMSGDTGEFRLRKVLEEKNEDGKYPVEPMGNKVRGVILKMRWKLSRYEDEGQSLSSTEYDNKYEDTITVFPMKEKGGVPALKEKYKMSTQRIVYFYLIEKDEIVRLVVKSSALTGDKNPGGEMGLFEYVDSFNETNEMVHEYQTVMTGVHRADPKGNKRKDYYAMTFVRGEKVKAIEDIQNKIVEVNEKVGKKAEVKVDAPEEEAESNDEITLDDIPFN